MYIDTTILVTDPTKNITTVPGTKTGQGLWSQIATDNQDVYRSPNTIMSERIDKLELKNKFLSLSIFMLEGKFTQEEVNNIKSMLTSNDEASITLADTIIENA